MSKMTLQKKQEQVEAMGVFFEKAGYSPMAGRVFSCLLLAEPPYQDFYQIQEFLSASKSATSNALNLLMKEGTVDYLTFSGDRKRYFRVNLDKWLLSAFQRVKAVGSLNQLLEDVLSSRDEAKFMEFNTDLRQVIEFNTFITNGLDKLIEEWKATH